MLLFVGYQLWGTGLQHSQAQGSLENDFLELLDSGVAVEAELAAAAVEPEDTEDEQVDDSSETASDDPQDEPEPEPEPIDYSPEFLNALYPEPGDSLSRIVIPDINVDQIVVAGVSVEDLRKGPGHYGSTPNPGMAGNSAIAGHRTTYGAPFHRIDELEPGAEVIVQTIQGTFTYKVRANTDSTGAELGHFIVSPSDTWVLGQDSGENLLTLTACHPKYSARQRIIVQAELVGEPAPTVDRGEDVDLEPVELDAGAEDERAQGEEPADDETASDIDSVMSDEVAADDDPSVDADGNPIETTDADDSTDASDAESGDAASDGEDADDAAGASATEEVDTDEAVDESEAVGATDEIELTDGESAASEAEDFGEGLNGDRTKIRPAIMWAIAGGAVWLAAWFVGQRLNRKWTLYGVGIVVFVPVLWSCFVNIDQALPSY